MNTFLKNNCLSLVLFSIFLLSLASHYITGWYEHNDDLVHHNRPPVEFLAYASEGHFLQTLFENWESEFLQMGAYVLLTVFLFQKGSADSKRPSVTERVDLILPDSKDDPEMPWPVRRGGFALKLYEYSLSIALFALFAVSFLLHAYGGAMAYNADQMEHGQETVTTLQFLGTSRFWFESFQNWQSEFLSIGTMIVLSIFLRQRGSPESKPVDSPHHSTGSE